MAPNQRIALGDWGTLVTLEQGVERSTGATVDARTTVTAVRVTLSAEHAGLPAGSEILIAHAEAAISAPAPTSTQTTTTTTTPTAAAPVAPKPRPKTAPAVKPKQKLPKPPEPDGDGIGIPRIKVRTAPTDISAPLSPGDMSFRSTARPRTPTPTVPPARS